MYNIYLLFSLNFCKKASISADTSPLFSNTGCVSGKLVLVANNYIYNSYYKGFVQNYNQRLSNNLKLHDRQ